MQLFKRLLIDYDNQRGLAYRFQQKRAKIYMAIVVDLKRKSGRDTVKIFDIRGTEEFWKSIGLDFLLENGIQIVLLNLPDAVRQVVHDDIFCAAEGNGCALGYESNSFDLAFSNSVIEHVGIMKDMRQFASEMMRVAPVVYCQTPAYWFPMEPYFLFPFQNWLPEPLRVFLIRRMAMGHMPRSPNVLDAYESVQSAQLLIFPAFQALFPKARIVKERVLGFTKSYIAVIDT